VVLLDLMIPGMDGLAVCRELRARVDTPILMITAREEEADRVLGLELGADDYIVKPFSSRELLARVRAQVRRARGRSGPSAERLEAGGLVIETASLKATLDGVVLPLTTLEFALLKVLAENAGRGAQPRAAAVPLARLGRRVLRSLHRRPHLAAARQAGADDSRSPRLLKTVRGLGYMLVPE
jgi:two-component system OmpR family response regulator